MWQVNKDEKVEALSMMLTRGHLLYYVSHVRYCVTYEVVKNVFHKRYNAADERSRILAQLRSMRFTEELSNIPDKQMIEMFSKFIGILTSLQKQLDPGSCTVDIPWIRFWLRDRTLCRDQQLSDFIANQLSENSKIVWPVYINYESSLVKRRPTMRYTHLV